MKNSMGPISHLGFQEFVFLGGGVVNKPAEKQKKSAEELRVQPDIDGTLSD